MEDVGKTVSEMPVPASPQVNLTSKRFFFSKTYIIVSVILSTIIVGAVLVYIKFSSSSQKSVLISPTPTPTVPLKEEYSNPFDSKNQTETQKANPFSQSETENPFDQLAQ